MRKIYGFWRPEEIMNNVSAFFEITCINKMDNEYKGSFKKLLEHYAKFFDSHIVLDGSAFTPHDLDHCLDIYKIISSCLLREDTTYKEGIGLSKRELFILNIAVLFHDIGMSQGLTVKRGNHSEESAEWVQKEYDDVRSTLRSETNLNPNEIKALKAIIKAHSNIKGDSPIPNDVNGIFSPELRREYVDLHSKPIRALFLAGILRLADELDITSERIGNGIIENQIKEGKGIISKLEEEGNEEELRKWEGFLESEKHWKKLHYFELICLSEDKKEIQIRVDDDYVERILDGGSTEDVVANEIIDVYTKIMDEFSDIKKVAFSDANVSILISAQNIVVKSLKIQDGIDKCLAKRRLKPIEKEESNTSVVEEKNNSTRKNTENELKNQEEINPIVIDEKLSIELEREVEERHLLQFGHFILNNEFCARDWLNIRELVETRVISKRIVRGIVEHINSRRLDNVLILGMDTVGALIAARVAFELKLPMSYFVSEKNKDYNSAQEIELEIREDERLIIITESIATFNTINDAITKNEIKEKVDSIYTVFYRKASINKDYNQELLKKTYCLNDSFPIELVNKEKCIYKDIHCFAKNKH